MKKHILSLLLLILPAAVMVLNAQSKLNEGYVKLEITEVGSDDENMAMQLQMMKGTEMELFFDEEQYMTKMNMMGGMMTMKTHINNKTKKMDMFMSAMGQKMWIDSNLDEAKESGGKADIAETAKIEYDKSKTKDILGYNAYFVTITSPEMQGTVVKGYITEEINSKANLIQGMESLQLKGFPLEFEVVSPAFSMTFSATEINKEVDKSQFEFVTEGYKKMTMKEFQESMGGMGSLGF